MIIKGDIFSRDELIVDGEVEGKVELQHRLTVGPRGKVRANIKAREIVVLGEVHGNVEVSDKITIQKNGSVIKTPISPRRIEPIPISPLR
jgi:cytoskeletal protein CcmA (bactofilin family)